MLVCVTGLTGNGKTTVMKIIKQEGFNIFIMDDWIHQIYKTNGIGFVLIKKHFGTQYINRNGVDRKKLGHLVFDNQNQLSKLNKIMIPIMQKKIAQLKSQNKLIFVELAIYLNYTSKFKKYFSKIICILRNIEDKKTPLLKKFIDTQNFPTIPVGKSQKNTLSNGLTCCYFVENYENKKYLQKQIKNFLTFYKK